MRQKEKVEIEKKSKEEEEERRKRQEEEESRRILEEIQSYERMIETAQFRDFKIMYNGNRTLRPFYAVVLLEVNGKAFVRVIEIGLNPTYTAKLYHCE